MDVPAPIDGRARSAGHALWAVSVASIAAALLLAPVVRTVDAVAGWPLLSFGPDGARALVGSLSSTLPGFLVFSFSVLLLVVQVAGGQLTPRIIARAIESRLAVATVGIFVFSWVFSLAALGRLEGRVPQLTVLVALSLGLGSLVLFLHLAREVSLGLRPVAVMAQVAEDTAKAIDVLHPHPFAGSGAERLPPSPPDGGAVRAILHRGRGGTVVSVDLAGVRNAAGRGVRLVEVLPRTGDFLAQGEELFRLHGEDGGDGEAMRRCVVLATERRLERDPAFGLRILVDIAIKALSPAINDPTTAVLALDRIHPLLHRLGTRRLGEGWEGEGGTTARVAYRSVGWEDYVSLAFTEIRLCGAASPQVTRRMRALLDRLEATLPPERGEALRREAELLAGAVARSFPDAVERRRAGEADLQGFGSSLRGGGA